MQKSDVVRAVLQERVSNFPREGILAQGFAPSNIALCKYWGKRDQEINLPVTSSLSVALGDRGSQIQLSISQTGYDTIQLNGNAVSPEAGFYKRLIEYVDLFRSEGAWQIHAEIQSTIPIGAGLASSACGFASLIQALDQFLAWQLDTRELSLLARLGSGSACRSLWPGFVEWQAGVEANGMDSHGVPLKERWPELCVGLLILSRSEKPVSSRVAMQRTMETSPRYRHWPETVQEDLEKIRLALQKKNFFLLGETAESNACAMHDTMLAAIPPINYSHVETHQAKQKVWQLREEGVSVYFTQDAGPNLKLLFLKQDEPVILSHFSDVEVVMPFRGYEI